MGRRKVEVRREEILVATIAEIERSGMSALRVSDIASALDVSSGLVFYHFDTKDSLLVEALEYAVVRDADRLDKALAKSGEPVERLRRVLTSYGPTGAAHGWTLWIEAWSTALREPPIQASLRKLDKRWRDALERVISEGVTSGHFACTDPRSSVARVGALLDGLSVAALIYQTVTRKQLQSWVRDATADEIGIDRAQLALANGKVKAKPRSMAGEPGRGAATGTMT
ncbi:MAG: TetR/AcrR family transcriptional regulator [Nocardioidaceae bacterium]